VLVVIIGVMVLVIGISATAENSKKVATQVKVSSQTITLEEDKSPGIPHVMSYFGYLEDDAGTPINGTKNMEFSIWDAPMGGTQLWSESHSVEVKNGHFALTLGETTPIPSTVFTAPDRWMQVKVETETLTPRTRISSMGYGYQAEQADNATQWSSHNWGDLYPNADKVDGYHAGNSSGQVPISNGTVCTNLNADKLDGYDYNNLPYAPTNHTHTLTYGGDLSGSGTVPGTVNATVTKIQGRPVSSSPPSIGEVLKWTGSQWSPEPDETGAGYWTYSNSELYPNDLSWRVGVGDDPHNNSRFFVDANGQLYGGLFYGENGQHSAVYGYSLGADYGVMGAGYTGAIAGVRGWDYNATYGVYSDGDFACSGSKAALVRTSKGPTEMYTIESPEIWFEDFGSGRLVNGKCHIELDPLFLETVTIDADNPMKVFVQLKDDCKGVYVRTGDTGFDVIELQGGTSNARFDYRVVAKRKGYETRRMRVVECGYVDRTLYPDDNDPAIPSYWKAKRQKDLGVEKRINESLK